MDQININPDWIVDSIRIGNFLMEIVILLTSILYNLKYNKNGKKTFPILQAKRIKDDTVNHIVGTCNVSSKETIRLVPLSAPQKTDKLTLSN